MGRVEVALSGDQLPLVFVVAAVAMTSAPIKPSPT
jgi:hypothetical protein